MLVIQRPTVEPVGEAEGNRQRFAVGPLEPGFGHTLGNSLRRTLLSSIPGAAITHGALRRRPARVRHHRRRHRGRHRHHPQPQGPRAHVGHRRAGDRAARRQGRPADGHRRRHQVPADVEILNPDLHIATLNDQGPPGPRPHRRAGPRLRLGRPQQGSRPSASSPSTRSSRRCAGSPSTSSPPASSSRPNYDRLVLDIETDGSITPRRRSPRPATRCGRWSPSSPT